MESVAYASIVPDVAIPKPLDYAIPPHALGRVTPGLRVKIPLRGRTVLGTVLELKAATTVPGVVEIAELLSVSIPPALLLLAQWMSRYYCTPFFKVLQAVLPPSVRDNMEEKQQLFVMPLKSRGELAELCPKLPPSQREIIEVMLQAPQGMFLSELLERSGASRSPVTSLARQKVVSLSPLTIDRHPLADHEFLPTLPKPLHPEQQEAFNAIVQSLHADQFQTHLILGVTGSGKTEVYLQAIESALSRGKSALFLVPEIALTPQVMEMLRGRFREKVAMLHHRLSRGERRDLWHQIRQGTVSLVVGARSALFSPMSRLGLIIVDEEHDGAYKQHDEMPCYHGRDVAVMRGKLENAVVVLGSATPSFESYTNALRGKYQLHRMTHRVKSSPMPKIEIVDMKLEYEKAGAFVPFSGKLLQKIQGRVALGEQTILFLNRRGFYASALCQACGQKIMCPHCTMTLTFHKGDKLLVCHLCRYQIRPPSDCPSCHSQDGLSFRGVGTEHIEASLHAVLPQVRTLRLDADTTRHKGSHELLLKQFRAGKADVLIGTQMISKGLHFPSVTLVGILNPDLMLAIPDFRSTEYAFQQITQVAGRAGRGGLVGEVVLQTVAPHYPLFQQLQTVDYDRFYHEEIVSRAEFRLPPACHLVKLLFIGNEADIARSYGESVRDALVHQLDGTYAIAPVVECGHPKINDHYRFQCLIKGEATRPITEALQSVPRSPHVRLVIDVDPTSIFF